MHIEQIYTGCLAQGAYYIESKGEVDIIDPLREISPYLMLAKDKGASIKYIFETHFHADFVSGHVTLAKRVYEAAANGLAAAHAKGLVHGDVKPANVLIGHDGRVRVADFGLAQSIGKANREDASGPWGGTLPYMAPELWSGAQPTPSTDVFALSVALWETLYRRRPFEGKTPMALHAAMLSGEPRVPWGAPAVPRALLELLLRGLSVEPSDRPSMAELTEAFAEIRSPMATLAMPSTPPASGRRAWVPFVEGMAVSLVLGLAGVLGVLGWLDRPQIDTNDAPKLREPPALDATEPPCALGDESVSSEDVSSEGVSSEVLDATVVAICQFIRDEHFRQADEAWGEEQARRLSAGDAGLGEQALIIARTFVEQAEAIQEVKPKEARAAASYAKAWVEQAAALLGESDVIGGVRERAEVFGPPGSTTSD
jgi:serine/threonine protein kinase